MHFWPSNAPIQVCVISFTLNSPLNYDLTRNYSHRFHLLALSIFDFGLRSEYAIKLELVESAEIDQTMWFNPSWNYQLYHRDLFALGSRVFYMELIGFCIVIADNANFKRNRIRPFGSDQWCSNCNRCYPHSRLFFWWVITNLSERIIIKRLTSRGVPLK